MMGADNLAQFHRWKDWQAIAASVPIAIFNRPGLALKALAGPAARTLAPFRVPEQAAASLAGTRAAGLDLPVPAAYPALVDGTPGLKETASHVLKASPEGAYLEDVPQRRHESTR